MKNISKMYFDMSVNLKKSNNKKTNKQTRKVIQMAALIKQSDFNF